MANISHIWFKYRIQNLHLKKAKVFDNNAHGSCKYRLSYVWKTPCEGEILQIICTVRLELSPNPITDEDMEIQDS